MSIVGRLLMMILAYLLACVAASLVLTIGALAPQGDDLAALGVPPRALWAIVGVAASVIAAVAMLPALLVIALAEGLAWRSVLVYGAAGGVLALALAYGLDFAGFIGAPDAILARERELFAASGIAGGLVYWLLAGRNAGAWRR